MMQKSLKQLVKLVDTVIHLHVGGGEVDEAGQDGEEEMYLTRKNFWYPYGWINQNSGIEKDLVTGFMPS